MENIKRDGLQDKVEKILEDVIALSKKYNVEVSDVIEVYKVSELIEIEEELVNCLYNFLGTFDEGIKIYNKKWE